MRFFHLADLHLGKMLHGYSLIDQGDQVEWVERFLQLAEREKPDAVVIAGDVYDRSIPSREAVALLDSFLTALCARNVPVLLVSGNHDSGPRLHFASALLEKQGLYIAGSVQKELRCVTLQDTHGTVHFWLMPYFFPAAVEEALGEKDIRSYDAAARLLLERQPIDPCARNVLIGHQLVLSGRTQPEIGGSETMVGGVGQIDYTAFDAFDYVALGHIHRPQWIGRESVRYAGSPLCYHFSEIGWKKGPLLVELGEKGAPVRTELFEIPPMHPLREIRGTLQQILDTQPQDAARGEYIRVVLTDRDLPAGAVDMLSALFRARGSYLMDVAREIPFADGSARDSALAGRRERSIAELFAEFYQLRTGGALPDAAEERLIAFAAEQIANAPEDISPEEQDALAQKLVAFALKQEEKEV